MKNKRIACTYRQSLSLLTDHLITGEPLRRSEPFWEKFFKSSQTIGVYKKLQVGKDQEKVPSEKDSHYKNGGGQKLN